ncbi:hypothetical protein, partial [Klebsiella pneumoniae]|uniref:hypothetical protein n=1 Tax=Klebsiella pneumoniae TaxID=573 RepID=UPI0023582788
MWSKSSGYLRAAQVTGEEGGLAQRVALVVGQVQGLGNDSNLLIVFYVQIVPDDFVMQLHR